MRLRSPERDGDHVDSFIKDTFLSACYAPSLFLSSSDRQGHQSTGKRKGEKNGKDTSYGKRS